MCKELSIGLDIKANKREYNSERRRKLLEIGTRYDTWVNNKREYNSERRRKLRRKL